MALGPIFIAVVNANVAAGQLEQAIAKPVHSTISPKKFAPEMYLNNPRNSVTDVAFMVGYSDVAQFSRNFKRWTGESPSDYQSDMAG